MCLYLRVKTSAVTASFDLAFLTWLRSARCVTALYYTRENAELIKCIKCKSTKSPDSQAQYSGIISHYLHFGNSFNPKKCDTCRVSLAAQRNIRDCDFCPRSIEEFVVQLVRSKDHPWHNLEPTIIILSQSPL